MEIEKDEYTYRFIKARLSLYGELTEEVIKKQTYATVGTDIIVMALGYNSYPPGFPCRDFHVAYDTFVTASFIDKDNWIMWWDRDEKYFRMEYKDPISHQTAFVTGATTMPLILCQAIMYSALRYVKEWEDEHGTA